MGGRLKKIGVIDQSIGSRVRARRKALGMNQAMLASRLDVTFQMIQRYECGLCRISASMLYLIARALKVRPSFFFEGLPETGPEAEPGPPMPSSLEMTRTRHGRMVADVFPRICDLAKRRAVAELVRAVAEDAERIKRRDLRPRMHTDDAVAGSGTSQDAA